MPVRLPPASSWPTGDETRRRRGSERTARRRIAANGITSMLISRVSRRTSRRDAAPVSLASPMAGRIWTSNSGRTTRRRSKLGGPPAGSRYGPVGPRNCRMVRAWLTSTHAGAKRASSNRSASRGSESASTRSGAAWPSDSGASEGGHHPLRDDSSAGVRDAAEHPQSAVDLLEQLRRLGDTLGGTEKQQALRAKRVVERSQDPALRDFVEIDQEIAAADQVQSRERRIARHVLTREEAEIADVLRNAVLTVLPDEETLEAFCRHLLHGIEGVHTRPRPLEGRLADIGPEHLDLQRRLAVAEVFEHRHGDGIDLLAGRAAGHPDTDRVFRGPAFTERGKHVLTQRLEGGRIAKELGDPDQEVLVQRGELAGIAIERFAGTPRGSRSVAASFAARCGA